MTLSESTEPTQADQSRDDDINIDSNEKEINQTVLPDFGKYLYFLVCPTLIYRDEYPL